MAKPFFILGCVRSGTTFLRNVLRGHPNLASPEETHFYRWPEPFGTPGFIHVIMNNKTLIRHRELDGISEEVFRTILDKSTSRSTLYWNYMHHYIAINKPGAVRWFDKTPQNVYGAALLASEFPSAQIIHIVRNPLDVVSSLKVGKVMHIPQIVGACNYWIESIKIMDVIRKAFPTRVYETKYEDMTSNFDGELHHLMEFLGEGYDTKLFDNVLVSPKRHDYGALFSPEERQSIEQLCGPFAERYGYFIKR